MLRPQGQLVFLNLKYRLKDVFWCPVWPPPAYPEGLKSPLYHVMPVRIVWMSLVTWGISNATGFVEQSELHPR